MYSLATVSDPKTLRARLLVVSRKGSLTIRCQESPCSCGTRGGAEVVLQGLPVACRALPAAQSRDLAHAATGDLCTDHVRPDAASAQPYEPLLEPRDARSVTQAS